MRDKKQNLRANAVLRRQAILEPDLRLWNRLIQEKVIAFPPYQSCRSVALYSAIGSEVETTAIRDHALENDKKVFYPKVTARLYLDLIRIESPHQLKPGSYGILEPENGPRLSDNDGTALIVFVPGLAFDLLGNRLGRGRGLYDRLLERLGGRAMIVALAHEWQILPELPVDLWDRKVHRIITERRIIVCENSASVRSSDC